MATINNDIKFANAVSQLVSEDALKVLGARFLDRFNRRVYDEIKRQGGNVSQVDITPDTATLESALDRFIIEQGKRNTRFALQSEARAELIGKYRQALIEADGSVQAMANVYDMAVSDVQGRPALAGTIKSLNAIEDVPLQELLTITLISDKKQFLRLFLQALSLWS